MWQFIMRQLLKKAEEEPFRRVGKTAAASFFTDDANAPEVYVERIRRDNHLQEYNDASTLYTSDPAYWQRWYAPLPSPDPAAEIQHNSVMAAGVPSRYNVLEYAYPEPTAPLSEGSLNPNQVVNDRFGT